MPLRFLIRYFGNNEELIRRLSESYPMRRAAQITASLYYRSKDIAQDKLKEANTIYKQEGGKYSVGKGLSNFKQNFSQEVKEAFKKLSEEKQRQKKKH